MGTIDSTLLSQPPSRAGDVIRASWALATGDDGAPIQYPEFADKTVQVIGTFGGGTVLIEGSNDGTNWSTLTDPSGSSLSFSAAGLKQVLECTQYIRPRQSGGAAVAVTVYLVARRNRAH